MPKVYELNGDAVGEVKMPRIFSTKYRPDVIKRAVLAMQSAKRQPYGSDVLAGKRTSAHYHGRRRYRFTMMNRELSRIPRIHGKGAGHMNLTARFAPHAVKGRRAHPPKAEKVWLQKINKKENLLAIKSAIATTANADLVRSRGHLFDRSLPIILNDEFEGMTKTKDVKRVLEKIVGNDIERCNRKKTRSGRGKARGRRYKKKKGPLIVVLNKCSLMKAAKNIPGVDITELKNLNAELLAPGAHAGRLAIFTKSALEKIDDVFG